MTTQDLKQIDSLLDRRFNEFGKKIELKIDEAVVTIIQTVDKTKVDKKEFTELELRVGKIEKTLRAV